jgi:hypothetical protein
VAARANPGSGIMATLVFKDADGREEVLKLKGGINRIGRSSANDYTILDGSVSRFHCEVEILQHSMSVHDLDSSNGTFVNDLPVEGRAALVRGQMLRLGNVQLEVREAPEPPPESATARCVNHPDFHASMLCTQCGKLFCGACVHILKRSGGRILRLCPACSGVCEALAPAESRPKGALARLLEKLRKRPPENHPFHG